MSDMLVKLYDLPDCLPAVQAVGRQGIDVRRPLAWEKPILLDWVTANFSQNWALECDMAFHSQPIRAFIGIQERKVVGFACYDCTWKNFFGPIGVLDRGRGNGLGKALLLSALHAMYANGYAYAVIGAAGAEGFFEKTVNARVIQGSTPGIYDSTILC